MDNEKKQDKQELNEEELTKVNGAGYPENGFSMEFGPKIYTCSNCGHTTNELHYIEVPIIRYGYTLGTVTRAACEVCGSYM